MPKAEIDTEDKLAPFSLLPSGREVSSFLITDHCSKGISETVADTENTQRRQAGEKDRERAVHV